MSGQGTTTVDFGAFPGQSDVTVTVTGQAGIVPGSLVEAWLYPVATSDHSVDEHIVDGPQVFAHTIVNAVGFSVTARELHEASSLGGDTPMVYGLWTVGWVWA